MTARRLARSGKATRRRGTSRRAPRGFPFSRPTGRSVGRSVRPTCPFVVANQTHLPRRSTPATPAGSPDAPPVATDTTSDGTPVGSPVATSVGTSAATSVGTSVGTPGLSRGAEGDVATAVAADDARTRLVKLLYSASASLDIALRTTLLKVADDDGALVGKLAGFGRESHERMELAVLLALESFPTDNPEIPEARWASLYKDDGMISALYSYFVKIERFEPIAGARPELVAEWVRREFTANQDTGCTRVNKLMFARFLSDSVWPIFGLQSWAQLRDKAMVALDDNELTECLTMSALDDAFVNFRGDLCPTFRFADAFDVMCATGATAEGEMRGTSASMSNFHDADVEVYGAGGAKENEVPEPGDWVSKSTKTDQLYIDWAFEGNTLVIHSGGVEPIKAVLQKMDKLVTESSAVVFKIGDDACERLGLDGGAVMCMPTGDGGRTKWGPRLCFKPAAARVEAGGTFTLFLNYPNPVSDGFAGYHARGAAEAPDNGFLTVTAKEMFLAAHKGDSELRTPEELIADAAAAQSRGELSTEVECMSGSARLLLAMRAVASPETFGANDLVFQASMEVSRLQLKRQVSEIDAEKRVQGQNYKSIAARGGAAGGAIGGAVDASEDTKAREGYGPNETKHSRAGAAFAVHPPINITCPFCRKINVRLTWTCSRDTVVYRHKRSCVDGKSKQQTIHINEEEVWRAFLHELHQDEFDKHKADVLS